jgi:superfamily II DNA or RNA helicase
LVPLESLERFTTTIKDSEGDDVNYQFYNHDFEKGVTHFARGDLDLIQEFFGDIPMEDHRAEPRMAHQIEFTKTLYPNQQQVADSILTGDGYGTISAPPRFGKTVVMCYIACKLGLKTIFLSHQIDLAKQALKTFYDFTNIMDLEYDTGKQIVGLVTKWSDLDKFDVSFMPYHKFVTGKGASEALEKYQDAFGLVFVDEVHRASATKYSGVVSNFNSKYRHGVSATIEIKSQRHKINNFVLGPIVAEGDADQVPCQVKIVETHIKIPMVARDRTFFGQMLTYLASHKTRNDFLVSYIAAYAEAGHFCIAVADRTNMINYIVERLNLRGITAQAFHAKAFKKISLREKALQKARSGEIRVLVAMRSMVLGLDIPRVTTFFNLAPTANPPNYYQEFSRVRTPFPGKSLSYVVDFVDNHPVAYSCMTTREKLYHEKNLEVL